MVIEKSGDEPVTVYKDTALGNSEVIPREHIQNVGISRARSKQETKVDKMDDTYNLRHVKTAVDVQLLIDEFSDVFSRNEWDIKKCDVTSHKSDDVYPGSRPVTLPNRRMPLHYKEDLR